MFSDEWLYSIWVPRCGEWQLKFLPPVLAEDYFIEVAFDRAVTKDDMRALVEAFRFEVNRQHLAWTFALARVLKSVTGMSKKSNCHR